MKKAAKSEQGGARLKFLIVIAIIGFLAYVGYGYVPVAYNAYLFKDEMQIKVDAATNMGHPPAWVSDQLSKSAPEYGVPPDAIIAPQVQGGRMECRVQFSRPIEFPGYTYEYNFDETVKGTTFMSVGK